MKIKKTFYFFVFSFVVILIALFLFSVFSRSTPIISNNILISFYTDQISIFDPNLNKIIDKIQLDSPYIVKKILRYNNETYIVAEHQVILISPNGNIKKIVNVSDIIVDGIIENGKLYTLGKMQIPGVPCTPQNLTKAFKSYITTFDLSLSQLSRVEFEQQRFEGLTISNNSFFVSSYLLSKVYKIYEDKIINEIQLPQKSRPSQTLIFGDKIIILGKKQIFAIPSDLSKFDILINESVCDYYSKAFIYNDKLYATCFTGNKTIVYDLLQNKLVKQINTTLPFYVWGFKDKIYVTSAFAKKLYVIDPNTNELIATIDFDEPPRVIG